MKLEDLKLLVYVGTSIIFIWFGSVTIEYIQVLKECEAAALDTYDPGKYCALLCQSSSNNSAKTSQLGSKNILLKLPDENMTKIMECQEKNSFDNFSEWAECNKIITRSHA